MAKAIVQDGRVFRVYPSADVLGDRDEIIDTVTAPVRCKSDADAREWFKQTLFARSLGDYAFV